MIIQLPVTTAVLEKNDDLCPNGKAEDNKIIIEFDTRKRDYHKMFKLKRGVEIRWINERSFDVQELSGFAWPIIYRITTADGYYINEQGQRVYFTPEDEFRTHRRDLKERGEAAQTRYYSEKLKRLAAKLWKNRYIFFKSDENLTAKEKETMQEVLRTQPEMSFLRDSLYKVWAIFEGPTTEAEAQANLAELKRYASHHENDGYTKSISFLEDNFKNMTTFLRVPEVQRNSLAETGMRVLRRLERNHDGFRSKKGRRNAIKIYQAVTYLGWSIHNPPNLAASSG